MRGLVLTSGPFLKLVEMAAVPVSDADEDEDGKQDGDGEPCGADLSVGKDDESRKQGADRRTGVAADLEEGLSEAVLAAGGESGYPGGFGVEDRGTHADDGGGDEEYGKAGRYGEQENSGQREDHADGERVGHGFLVGKVADDGLQERGDDLVGEGDETDLGEAEMEGDLEDGVDRGEQRPAPCR